MFKIVALKDGYNSVLCTDGQFREENAIGGKSWTGKVFKVKEYKSEARANSESKKTCWETIVVPV